MYVTSMINLLVGAKVYLSGAIEADQNASTWRNRLTPRLEELGMTVWDPLVKPDWMAKVDGPGQAAWKAVIANQTRLKKTDSADEFVKNSHAWSQELKPLLEIEQMNREIRKVCLKIAGHCDLMLVKIDKKIFTVGTWEELTVAVQRSIPIFILCDEKIPSMWLVDMLDAYYKPDEVFFQTEDALIKHLSDISTGVAQVDKSDWASITF